MDPNSVPPLLAGDAADEATEEDSLAMDDGDAGRAWAERSTAPVTSVLWVADGNAEAHQLHRRKQVEDGSHGIIGSAPSKLQNESENQ